MTGAAVVGTGVVGAAGTDVAGFTAALAAGRSAITATPLGPAAELGPWSLADALSDAPEDLRGRALRAAGRAPRPVAAAVGAAVQAWVAAGCPDLPGDRVGVVVAGHNLTDRYTHDLAARYADRPHHLPARFALHALDSDHLGTLSEVLGATGEGWVAGAASASGTVGVVHGARLVAAGLVDCCVVVGALTELTPWHRRGFAVLGALAADDGDPAGACRPFDADRRGFVPGEAAAALVLESPASAARRGAEVAAVVAGTALGLDANRLADPDAGGQARVVRAALAAAGTTADRLDYVCAHATASRLGDATEARALRAVLGAAAGRPWVNATKGLTGHCLSAAGVLAAVATVAQMGGGFVHPNANLRTPLDDRLRFVGATAEPAGIRWALSTGFGFGGANAAVVLRAA
ncbi:beta-ketoacyl synthase N-terminal-like domain-containing protein [Actinokineospora bangkokensis]|uniref:Polyketide beta-ketoacyl:ACP synthase n=1 Tax=Actinokineospora bangkokensis TaxID=1193682 RepID=A0A1Q9LS42_9PSEU|nr:beta-ketoacyl synthase N-terminal-like domain-containing protein [Actinokineospora bangkokensis]OLR94830.1 polyketide beta-ketoacyl:ACP synthase [Actinokineospora bangkokensis]